MIGSKTINRTNPDAMASTFSQERRRGESTLSAACSIIAMVALKGSSYQEQPRVSIDAPKYPA